MFIDACEADPATLGDVGLIFSFLDALPAKIGMQKIGPPQMAQFTDCDKNGVTGIVMIVTSHISIHTYTDKACFFMDVFSCKPFDANVVVELVRKTFKVGRLEYRVVERGHDFNRDLPKR